MEVSMHAHLEKSEELAALLLRHWDTYDAELKADLLQLAERLGCNWWDVVIDCCVKRCNMAWQQTTHLTDPLLSDESPRP
jgi:hypothetical protein